VLKLVERRPTGLERRVSWLLGSGLLFIVGLLDRHCHLQKEWGVRYFLLRRFLTSFARNMLSIPSWIGGPCSRDGTRPRSSGREFFRLSTKFGSLDQPPISDRRRIEDSMVRAWVCWSWSDLGTKALLLWL